MPRKKKHEENEEQRCKRQNANRLSRQRRRQMQTDDQREKRRQIERDRQKINRQQETDDKRQKRRQVDRQRQYVRGQQGRKTTMNVEKAVDVSMYWEDLNVMHKAGPFTGSPCTHCGAFKWQDESESTCCAKGKVKLHPIKPLPPRMVRLYDINENPHFLKNIVAYNNLLALASLGYNKPNDGVLGFRPTFKIQGKMYHRIGSLLPTAGEQPKFAQLYFHDSDFELHNRMRTMDGMKAETVQVLQEELHAYNPYIRSFKAAIDLPGEETRQIVLCSESNRKPSNDHCRRYNLPVASEVAAIMPGEGNDNNLDVIIHYWDGGLQRINPIHRSYDPLFYVLLFPQGDDGWQRGLHRTNGRTLSASDFYSYRLQIRANDPNIITKSRRLMQQYAVDSWAKIEGSRMQWVQQNQKTIRAEKYQGLIDAIAVGDANVAGRRVIC